MHIYMNEGTHRSTMPSQLCWQKKNKCIIKYMLYGGIIHNFTGYYSCQFVEVSSAQFHRELPWDEGSLSHIILGHGWQGKWPKHKLSSISQMVYEFNNEILWSTFYFNFVSNNWIKLTQFCICLLYSVVMASAKLWPDWIAIVPIQAIHEFTKSELWGHRGCVQCIPGSIRLSWLSPSHSIKSWSKPSISLLTDLVYFDQK